jgi:hypothetical protein
LAGAAATGAFGAAGLAAGALAAAGLTTVAFAAGLAVLLGIALLLFFEDFAAGALVVVRPLDALRLAAATFLASLWEALAEVLFLRVFCDTACARKLPRPCFDIWFHGNPTGPTGLTGVQLNVPNIAHFPQKSMI